MNVKYLYIIVLIGTIASCKSDKKELGPAEMPALVKAIIPRVEKDSAFSFIEKQLSFGTRVPGSDGHLRTKEWIIEKMKAYGASVDVQEFNVSFLTVNNVKAYNIIARLNPDMEKRVALFAHWDTRLIAEKDKNNDLKNKPIPGAVDGASGVAGLIEIARLIHSHPINLGVDFVFFDAEDQGDDSSQESWCLGSQYWSKSIKDAKVKPQFGILLDLIGAKGATYSKEEISYRMAGDVQAKIWNLASAMGKGNLFFNANIGAITDDHFYVNTIANIKTVNIIETKPSGFFGDYHHTHADNMDAIDKDNLGAVIQVVTATLYKTSDGSL